MPITLIGGDWYFNIGRHVRFNREPHGKFLVSLLHAMGEGDVERFGDRDGSRGTLAGVAK